MKHQERDMLVQVILERLVEQRKIRKEEWDSEKFFLASGECNALFFVLVALGMDYKDVANILEMMEREVCRHD